MQKIIFLIAICLAITTSTSAQLKDRVIYGKCTKDSLLQEPYSKWFQKNYDDYKPNVDIINLLKKQQTKELTLKVFFGSWCGDSKREVPRFIKLMNEMGIAESKIQIIALGNSDSLQKQSPTGEEKGLGIFRVPVFIVYKNGKEINRINEYPAMSIEKDMLAILNNENYIPNYASFALINKWLLDGTFLDENISALSLANQMRQKVSNENELNSVAYLLQKHQYIKEALKLFKVNFNLYPTSANVMSSLAEAFIKNKEKDKAVQFLELAIKNNKEEAAYTALFKLLNEANGLK
jgi:thiol-disulfide isomerase/thioredoxin